MYIHTNYTAYHGRERVRAGSRYPVVPKRQDAQPPLLIAKRPRLIRIMDEHHILDEVAVYNYAK